MSLSNYLQIAQLLLPPISFTSPSPLEHPSHSPLPLPNPLPFFHPVSPLLQGNCPELSPSGFEPLENQGENYGDLQADGFVLQNEEQMAQIEGVLGDQQCDWDLGESQQNREQKQTQYQHANELKQANNLCENYCYYEPNKFFQEQRQSSTNNESCYEQHVLTEWYCKNPRKNIISKLKSILTDLELQTNQDQLLMIKNVMGDYFFEYEKYYFNSALEQMQEPIDKIISGLVRGVNKNFKKKISGLTFEQRRLKLVNYMEKKRRRTWLKKVNYDCRKKVAEGRLRIKGKFVTFQKARQLLGFESLEGYNADEIRVMLEKRNPDC